mmetsp:Transcript_13176/g.14642  ORF Transcript_13176/g.14642 Transcript_13176/m.14642 type:complete len:111 (+) Transcript_13176:26-358(+)
MNSSDVKSIVKDMKLASLEVLRKTAQDVFHEKILLSNLTKVTKNNLGDENENDDDDDDDDSNTNRIKGPQFLDFSTHTSRGPHYPTMYQGGYLAETCQHRNVFFCACHYY